MSRARGVGLAGLLAGLLAGCARPDAASVAPPDTARVPAREVWDARLVVLEQGRPRLRLEAPYLASFEGDSVYSVLESDSTGRAVTAQLFDAAGQPSATVTARRLVYREAAGAFVAEGGVVVNAQGGRRLDAETVRWDDAARRVEAPGFVRFTSPTEQVEGYNLRADESFVTYSLGRTRATVVVER